MTPTSEVVGCREGPDRFDGWIRARLPLVAPARTIPGPVECSTIMLVSQSIKALAGKGGARGHKPICAFELAVARAAWAERAAGAAVRVSVGVVVVGDEERTPTQSPRLSVMQPKAASHGTTAVTDHHTTLHRLWI